MDGALKHQLEFYILFLQKNKNGIKKTLLFFTITLFIAGFLVGQTPSTMWENNADIQWYNNQDSEFTLNTPAELAGLSVLVAGGNDFLGKTIIIDSDIDLGAHLWTPIGVDNSLPFSGSVKGKSHMIRNLYIEMAGQNYVGLFGRCIGAEIMDVFINNASIRGQDSAGSLVGNLWQGGSIENCHASNVVIESTGDNVGGLVGDLVDGTTMDHCSFKGSVKGGTQVGGLVGSPYDGNTITDCYSAGTVHGVDAVGGLIGASVVGFPGTTESIINNCYSRADVMQILDMLVDFVVIL